MIYILVHLFILDLAKIFQVLLKHLLIAVKRIRWSFCFRVELILYALNVLVSNLLLLHLLLGQFMVLYLILIIIHHEVLRVFKIIIILHVIHLLIVNLILIIIKLILIKWLLSLLALIAPSKKVTFIIMSILKLKLTIVILHTKSRFWLLLYWTNFSLVMFLLLLILDFFLFFCVRNNWNLFIRDSRLALDPLAINHMTIL